MSAPAPGRLAVVLAFAAVYFVWGSTFLGMRIAVESFPPFLMAGARYGLAGCLLYGFSRATGAARPTSRQWKATGITGLTLILVGNGGTAFAMKYIPSSLGALLAATIPMFMALFAWWSGLTSRPSLAVCAGLILGFSGVGLLLKPGGGAFAGGGWIGVAAMLFASLVWAVGSLIVKQVKPEHLPRSPALVGGMQMLCGGGLLLLAGGLFGEWSRFEPSAVTPRALWALLYLLIFGSIIAYTAYIWLLRVCDASKVGTYAFVNPIVAVALGWSFAGETIDRWTLVGAAMIVTGAAIIISRQPKKVEPKPGEPVAAE